MRDIELHEKIQELRKSRGMTQEELAEVLFVSRTAISKWESGRGFPSIDSLKAISRYFSVTIDDLLSGEELIILAEEENASNLHRACDHLMACVDLLSLLLIFLPLYPKTVDGYIYGVNLLNYRETGVWMIRAYWLLFIALTTVGILKMLTIRLQFQKGSRLITALSLGLSILGVFFLALAREPYASTLVFLLLVIKAGLIFLIRDGYFLKIKK